MKKEFWCSPDIVVLDLNHIYPMYEIFVLDFCFLLKFP